MLLQPQRHLALAERCDEAALDGMLAKQLQRPACATLRRISTSQSNHLLLLSRRKRRRSTRSWRVVQRSVHTLRAKPLAHTANCSIRTADVLSNLFVREPLSGFQQDQGSSHHAHGSCAALHQLPQTVSGPILEADNVFLHAGAYTTGSNIREQVLGVLRMSSRRSRSPRSACRMEQPPLGTCHRR